MDRRNDLLKTLAMATMAIDHIGVLLLPQLLLLRVIGRIAFPIFAYQLAVGFSKTRSRGRYASRILLFGLLAQGPYMFLNYSFTLEPFHFNVMLFFAYALGMLQLWEKRRYGLAIALLLLPDVLVHLWPAFAFSYGSYGLAMVLLFHLFKEDKGKMLAAYTVLTVAALLATGNAIQALSFMGMLAILSLEEVPGPIRLGKWTGYIFYPVHIALLCLVRLLAF